MPLGAGSTLLATERIAFLTKELADRNTLPQQLKFLNRTRLVDATDGEILARITGRVIIADIVANDQKALVRAGKSIRLEHSNLPNIKIGAAITQEQLLLLNRINQNGTIPGEEGQFSRYIDRTIEERVLGVRQRMEHMCVGMAIDEWVYNEGGLNLGTLTFGMPTTLKVTPAVAWSVANAATMTPIADIESARTTARDTYGKEYDRITMSTAAFQAIIGSTEFRNKSSGMLQFVFDANTFASQSQGTMQQTFTRVLNGMELELYDAQYTAENMDGSQQLARYLPTNKVVLSSRSDDNNEAAYDFGNAVVAESMLGSDASLVIGGALPNFSRGPVGFATPASHDLNPPGVNLWAVARGLPRLKDQTAFSVLTVG